MSQRTYNDLWAGAQVELRCLLKEEQRIESFQRLATLYVRYLQMFRQLEEAHHHVVHPQKRRSILVILESVIGRVLELKNEMVEKEFSEFHYMNDVLRDLKLTPAELEIPIPHYFIDEGSKEVQNRTSMLKKLFKLVESTESPELEEELKKVDNDLIPIVQKKKTDEERPYRIRSRAEIESAVICIQKNWRGYAQRRQTRMARNGELIFLGMALDPTYLVPRPIEVIALANKASTLQKKKSHEEDFQEAIVSATTQLRDVEGPDMRENIKDQIRQWFLECRDGEGTFPDYPLEEDGGSAVLFAERNPQEVAETIAFMKDDVNKNKPKGKEEKNAKQANARDDIEETREENTRLKMLPSAFLADLEEGHKVFVDVWQNRSESTNLSQKHEIGLIMEEKTEVIDAEIRLQVDEEMRKELSDLKLLVDKDKGGKKKAGKKKKGGKKKGEVKETDLTPDRTLESLCQELVDQGLMKPANNVRLQDYLGDYYYRGTKLRHDMEPMPSWSGVRQVIALYGILPLGSKVVHAKAPLIKGILLVGPDGVGKRMLVHAICRETGAALFDLSPMNIAGKYPGKTSLNMMLHIVFKVARQIQPSVIWVGEAEKMFSKKPPQEDNAHDPNRLRDILPKFLKLIKGESRVLVVGTTMDPLSAEMKPLGKVFSKIILIPRPEYGSRHVLWRELIKKHRGVVTDALDISFLAKITEGYSQGHIVTVIQSILTKQRIREQANRPLTAAEFADLFDSFETLYKEEEAIKKWYTKTPLGKKRAKGRGGKGGGKGKKGK